MASYYGILNDLFDQLAIAQADSNTLEAELLKSHIYGLLEGARLLDKYIDTDMIVNWQEVA